MEPRPWDVIVIGGGPAGLSAALLLGRARRRVVVLDTGEPRNRFAGHMHGVLGNEGVAPADLLERGRAEVAGYGARVRDGTVERVHEADGGLTVTLSDGETLRARALVVASGITDELPDVPGLVERWGATVLHCPYCHGWEFADQRLGVLTTDPSGIHQAELVRQWSDAVVVFTAGAGDLTDEQRRRLQARGIRMVGSPVTEVLGDGDQLGVRCADGETILVDALYTAGTPRTHDGFLTDLDLERTEIPLGSVLTVDAVGQTSHPRIWAAGTVVNPAATIPMAISDGAMAGGAVNLALVADDIDAALG